MTAVAPALQPTLKTRALRAGGWSMGGYAASLAIRLGTNLLMARLLAPEMFGILAIAMTVTVVLSLLSDCGLQQNIVQSRRGNDPLFLDTAWLVQIARGFAIWLVALGISLGLYLGRGLFPVDSVYAAPVLPQVIAAYAFTAVIVGFQSMRVATALRGFEQKRLVQIELVAQCAALAVMALIGAATGSVWTLVAGGLVATACSAALSHRWLDGHANRLRWEPAALRELIAFGKWLFLSSAVYVLAAVGDRILLGGWVEAGTLGMYAIAVLILGAIEGGLHRLFMAVSLPALAEVARTDPTRLREVYYRLRVPGDLLLLFLAGALFVCGPLVIDVLYDARYAAAGPMLQVLAISFIAARYLVVMQVYVAVGVPRYQTYANIARFVSIYTLVPAGYALGGVQGALWGIALHAFATVPFVYAFNARLGLNDWRKEALVLAALPAGYLCGAAANLLHG